MSWRRAVIVIGRRVVEERARRRGAVVRSARTVVAEKRRVAARSCGRVAGEGEDGGRMTVVERGARGRGRGRWSSRVTCEESCEETGSERGASECGRVAVAVEDGTERTGRVARRQRGAVVEALEVESVRRGLHGCRLLQLPVSRSAEVR